MSKTETIKSTNFRVYLNCVIIATNIPINKKYILSLNQKDIILPFFELNNDNKVNTEQYLISKLRENYIFVSELELIPQLISLNFPVLNPENKKYKNHIDVIYAFLVDHTNNINNAHWVEFDYMESNAYTSLICEVVQKLR